MQIKIFTIGRIFIFTFYILIVNSVLAEGCYQATGDICYNVNTATVNLEEFGDFTPVESVGEMAQKIILLLMEVLGGFALLGVIAGGIMIMHGGFSESTMESGKDLLFYSVIGVGVALLSMVIVTFVQSFFYSFGT